MQYALVAGEALFVSALTLFSGFGLGKLLMPAFALFLPVPVAVAATAVVHLANNLFKLALVGRKAVWTVVVRFALPAAAAIVGAMLLGLLADVPPLLSYSLGGETRVVTPVKLTVGVLMMGFALFDSFSPPPGASPSTGDTASWAVHPSRGRVRRRRQAGGHAPWGAVGARHELPAFGAQSQQPRARAYGRGGGGQRLGLVPSPEEGCRVLPPPRRVLDRGLLGGVRKLRADRRFIARNLRGPARRVRDGVSGRR